MRSCMHSHVINLDPRSGELRTQKLKSHRLRTQSLKVLPLKPGVGQYIATHATLTARDCWLISSLPVHSPAFLLKPLLSFSVLAVANADLCVGPQNEIGHPAYRYGQLMQVPVISAAEYK